MSGRRVLEIPVGVIDEGERLRAIDADQVKLLAASIAQRGLMTPITVTEGDADGRHRLIAGAHRLAAVRWLEWRKIEAFVVGAEDADQTMLREIEENLVRVDLTELDRAVFLSRWREIYDRLHPEQKKRGRPKTSEIGTNLSRISETFKDMASKRLRVDEKTVNRALERAKIALQLRTALKGHPAENNGVVLDGLARLMPEQQAALAEDVTAGMPLAELRERVRQMRAPGDRAETAPKSLVDRALAMVAQMTEAERAQFRERLKKLPRAST